MAAEQSIALFYQDDRSDKVYHAALERQGGGFIVTFQYGRRGGPLKAGVKTAAPTSYDAAWSVYDKLVREKVGKGYREKEGSGAVYRHIAGIGRQTGFKPQLLTPLTESEAVRMIMQAEPGRFAMQRKLDGERRMISIRNRGFIAANRKGIEVAVNDGIVTALEQLGHTAIELDGEDMGDHFVAFNVLSLEGENFAARPFADAAALLDALASTLSENSPNGAIRIETATKIMTAAGLIKRMEAYRGAGEEGVVLRDLGGITAPGRGGSTDGAWKIKFVETATVVVGGANPGKRSVQMTVTDDSGRWIDVGSVTVPPNMEVPNAGELVEVRYLYAYMGGSLFQPVLLRRRDDIDATAATSAQLKFKRESEVAAA